MAIFEVMTCHKAEPAHKQEMLVPKKLLSHKRFHWCDKCNKYVEIDGIDHTLHLEERRRGS